MAPDTISDRLRQHLSPEAFNTADTIVRAAVYHPAASWYFTGLQSGRLGFRLAFNAEARSVGRSDLPEIALGGTSLLPHFFLTSLGDPSMVEEQGRALLSLSPFHGLNLDPEIAPEFLCRAIGAGATIHAPTFEDAGKVLVLEDCITDLVPALDTAVSIARDLPFADPRQTSQARDRYAATGWTAELPPILPPLWLHVIDDVPYPEPMDMRSALARKGVDWKILRPQDYAKEHPLRLRTVSTQREPRTDFLISPSSGHYYGLQQALSLQTFEKIADNPFPRARLDRGGVQGFAELRPHPPDSDYGLAPEELEALEALMWRHCEDLGDSDADTLDAIMSTWLESARSPSDRVPIYVDDLLRIRGLKPKRSGSGRRGGFEPEQRAALWRCLLHLQDIWIDIAEAKGKRNARTRPRVLQSKALVMTDRVGQRRLDGAMDVEAILVAPGEAFGRFLFGPGRQAAYLSAQALKFDPYRQGFEKRLTRMLSWHWRSGARDGHFLRRYRIRTLAEEIGIEANQPKPARTRERLEKALDCLQDAKVIAGWQYDGWSEDQPRQGWFRQWLAARILIEAPDAIKEAYRDLDQLNAPRRRQKRTTEGIAHLGIRLRHHRKALELTQIQAAEVLGIGSATISRLERTGKASSRIRSRVMRWLDG